MPAVAISIVFLALVAVAVVVVRSRSGQPDGPTSPFHAQPADAGAVPLSPPIRLRAEWLIPYGVYLCDHFVDPFENRGPGQLGVDTEHDGLIHVRTISSSNEPPTLATFADQVGLKAQDGSIELPDGTRRNDGDTCIGRPGRWKVRRWALPDPAPPTEESADLHKVELADRDALTLAFVDDEATVPLPPAAIDLINSSVASHRTTAGTAPLRSRTGDQFDPPGFAAANEEAKSRFVPPPDNVVNNAGDRIPLYQSDSFGAPIPEDLVNDDYAGGYEVVWTFPTPDELMELKVLQFASEAGREALMARFLAANREQSWVPFGDIPSAVETGNPARNRVVVPRGRWLVIAEYAPGDDPALRGLIQQQYAMLG